MCHYVLVVTENEPLRYVINQWVCSSVLGMHVDNTGHYYQPVYFIYRVSLIK